MDEIIGDFLVESYEGLDSLEQNFVVLEETQDDTPTLTEAFRSLHTIKGTCGFLGFSQLETVAHRGENLLSLLRDAVLEMDEEITDALLATNDAIRQILEVIEETGEEGQHDYTELVARLERLANPDADNAAEDEAAEANEGDEAEAAEGEAAEATADDAAEVAAEEPQATDEPAEAPGGSAEPAAVEAEAAEAPADEAAQAPAEPAAVEAEAPAPAEPSPRIGDILVDEGSAARTDVEVAATQQQEFGDDRPLGNILVDEGRAERDDVEKAAAKQKSSAADSTIRVDVAVLDTLMNLVGELVLSRNQIIQLAGSDDNQEFVAPAQRLNLITSELQEGVMKTRMQPIGNVWNKFPRVVRDLAHQFDKQIRLEMEGKDTELDRTILEAIKDPLTHMVRNTADHGIESPEARVAAGKEPEGVLRLSATHEGGQVNIEISDDGAGIDAAFMRSKCVEKGLISQEEADRLSDSEAVQLIFRPGFSTAQKVSNVSGRGVGMDVVRTNIERIGGSVDIKTALGQGTTFKIKIPLTLAIIPAIVVNCDGNRYAIPQLSLQELVRLDEAQRIENVHGAPVYRLRDKLLPIVDLREQLEAEPVDRADGTNIVVLQADGHPFGLVVDAIEDTEEIVVKPLGRGVKDISLFSGATIMGDGTVALILDVMGLASASSILKPGSQGSDAGDHEDALSEMQDMLDDRTILMVAFGDQQRAALPLDQVDRLEEFPRERIESSDHRDVVQYRGEIMPILDLGPKTGRGGSAMAENARVSVVVCSVNGVSVGLAVSSILDIVSQPEVHRNAEGYIETAIVSGQVVDVVDAHRLIRQTVPVPDQDPTLAGVH